MQPRNANAQTFLLTYRNIYKKLTQLYYIETDFKFNSRIFLENYQKQSNPWWTLLSDLEAEKIEALTLTK